MVLVPVPFLASHPLRAGKVADVSGVSSIVVELSGKSRCSSAKNCPSISKVSGKIDDSWACCRTFAPLCEER